MTALAMYRLPYADSYTVAVQGKGSRSIHCYRGVFHASL